MLRCRPKGVVLSFGGSEYDPKDPVGRLLLNMLGMVAECEPGRSRAAGEETPVPGRVEYPATKVLTRDQAEAVTTRHQQ